MTGWPVAQSSSGLGLVVGDTPFDHAVVEHVEADLLVRLRLAQFVGAAELALDVVAHVLVEPLHMHAVERVLHDLQPIARHDGEADLAHHAVVHEQVPGRQNGHRIRTQIAEEQSAHLCHLVGRGLDLVLVAALRVLGVLVGLLDAVAGVIERPAMIGATQTAFGRDAVDQRHAAVRATRGDQAELAVQIAEENEVLAEQPHREGVALLHLRDGGDGIPITPQQTAHRRAWSHPGQTLVLFLRKHEASRSEKMFSPTARVCRPYLTKRS